MVHPNIKKFTFFQIFKSFDFVVPIFVIFWKSNDLNLTEIMILQSFFAIFVVLLEVPTGYLADIFGRKNSLVLGAVFYSLGFFFYFLGYNFWQFLIAEFILAISISLISGADSAFIYDSILENNPDKTDLEKEKRFQKFFGSINFYGLIALSVSTMVGGVLVGMKIISIRYLILLNAIFLIPAIIISFSFREPKIKKIIFNDSYLKNLFLIFKKSFYEPKIRYLIFYSAIIFSLNQACLWLYQPYLELCGVDILYFGLIFASFNIVAAISSKYAHHFEKKFPRASLFLPVVLLVFSYFLMAKFIFIFAFIFIYLQQFTRSFYKVVMNDWLNKIILSENRATICSIQSMVSRLLYALFLPFVGMVGDKFSLITALYFLGFLTLFLGFFSFYKFKKVLN